jgi:signal transduction histidine kinase
MTVAIVVGGALAAATALLALVDPVPHSALRHGYLLPIVVAALRFGVIGGTLASGAGVLLYAPFVLPEFERSGIGDATIEGLVTTALLAGLGPLGGALVTTAARERARYETLGAVQRVLGGAGALENALPRLRACLRDRLDASAVGLVVRDGEGLVLEGGGSLARGSLAERVVEGGTPVFVPDAGGERRPRRVLGVPLTVSGQTIGALLVERVGEFGAGERTALLTLGAHVGLGLENARLASRQRQFTEELAARVAAATHRLEEADRAKSAFVAIASHELRTPLTALRGFSELLASRDFAPAEVRRIGGILEREIERLVRIVDDFLDLSRVERGLPPTLCRRPLVLAPLIEGAVDLFRRPSGRCRIVAACEPTLPRVDADPDALERILHNLLSNAVKYAKPDGSVRVTASAHEDGVAVTVEDDGRGIPAEALPRVFEPYFRAADAAGAVRGAGIGLAIVKSLVEGHGGAVRVESAVTRGTRVTFTLPAVR